MNIASYSRRLDRLEKAIQLEHAQHHGTQTSIRRFSGDDARAREREYIITQARAKLGLCDPDPVIFLSHKIKLIKEEYPGFPGFMSRESAKQLIEEYENEAA